MANYAASVLAKGQTIVTQKYQAPEMRSKVPSVMALALRNQEISIPNAAELRVSDKRTVEINYFNFIAPGSGTAKAHNHTGSYGDSSSVTLAYVTHVEPFQLPRKIAQNNVMTYQAMWNNLYEQKWRNLRTRHDTTALSFLWANRMQLSAATVNAQIASANPGTYNDTAYVLEVTAADKRRFAQMAKSYLDSRYFRGEYDVIANIRQNANMEFDFAQGAGNDMNLAFQNQGIYRGVTQDAINASYVDGIGLWMPRGAFAALQWNDPLNRAGVNSGENEVGLLSVANDPFGSGATADISMYTKRADTSANSSGGNTQDIVDEWEISLTIGYALPPLTAAGDSVVHAIAQGS